MLCADLGRADAGRGVRIAQVDEGDERLRVEME